MEQTLQGDVDGVDIEDTNVWGVPFTPFEEGNVENYVLSHAYFTFHFIRKGLGHLTLQYPPHHTLGKKSWSHGRGGHKMCEEVIHTYLEDWKWRTFFTHIAPSKGS
jgi:hypothetical protein